jgi:hypothetical protein
MERDAAAKALARAERAWVRGGRVEAERLIRSADRWARLAADAAAATIRQAEAELRGRNAEALAAAAGVELPR